MTEPLEHEFEYRYTVVYNTVAYWRENLTNLKNDLTT